MGTFALYSTISFPDPSQGDLLAARRCQSDLQRWRENRDGALSFFFVVCQFRECPLLLTCSSFRDGPARVSAIRPASAGVGRFHCLATHHSKGVGYQALGKVRHKIILLLWWLITMLLLLWIVVLMWRVKLHCISNVSGASTHVYNVQS